MNTFWQWTKENKLWQRILIGALIISASGYFIVSGIILYTNNQMVKYAERESERMLTNQSRMANDSIFKNAELKKAPVIAYMQDGVGLPSGVDLVKVSKISVSVWFASGRQDTIAVELDDGEFLSYCDGCLQKILQKTIGVPDEKIDLCCYVESFKIISNQTTTEYRYNQK